MYWLGLGCVAYTYAAYPALLFLLAKTRPRPVRRSERGQSLPTVSVVMAAYNEEAHVARRLEEFTRRITENGLTGEIIVISDGSTDATAEVASGFEGGAVPVTVVRLPENLGKAAALSAGCAEAVHEVIVFADARQSWADDALVRLLENFGDPEVGAVSGELFVEAEPGVLAGVGLYWRFEKALRRREGLIGSTVGVTGSISAVRRALFRPIPGGTVLDDVYWPLVVALKGYRVVFDGRARAFDRLPEKVGAELRRKVRTLAGNFQLVARLPEVLWPRRNPVWFALVSHKLMRLTVPWAFVVMGGAAFMRGGTFYQNMLAAQVGLTLVGASGLVPAVGSRSRVLASAGSFLMLNVAAWLAFWVWATGRASRAWTKTRYRPSPAPLSFEGAAR